MSFPNFSLSDWLSNIFVEISIQRLGTTNSEGITTSFPYTSLNGVCFVSLLQVILYAQSIIGMHLSQSPNHLVPCYKFLLRRVLQYC